MDKFNLTSAKLTGNPGSSGWSQVHEFIPEDEEKLLLRGHLFAVIATARQEEGVDSVTTGRELLARLHEEYFGKEEGTPFNTLRIALEKVINEFKQSWGDVQIAAMVSLGDVVYSAAGGGAQISIFRNGMLAGILESTKEQVVSASGYPKDNDLLLLGTDKFFKDITVGIIKAACEAGEAGLTTEALAPTIASLPDNGSIGVVVVKFAKDNGLFKEKLPSETVAGGQLISRSNILRDKIKTMGDKIVAFGVGTFNKLAKKLPEKRIFIRGMPDEEGTSKGRKTMVLVGVILLSLLLVSIGFGIKQKRNKDQRAKYETRLVNAQHQIDEAIGLVTLDPTRARELFAESRKTSNELVLEDVKDADLTKLIEKLDQNQGSLLGEYKEEPQIYLDLSILSDGLSGNDLAGSSEKFFVLDIKGKKIVGIDVATKKTEVVAGPDLIDSPLQIASYEKRVFLLTTDGIYEYGKTKTKVVEKDWTGDVYPYLYAGNIYLLDKQANTVWRYAGAEGVFGSKQKWLAPTVTVDFSKVNAITIDGTIWVVTSSGKILRFNMGNPIVVSLSGIFPEMTSAESVYSNEGLKGVYILDRNGKRIVVLDKNGKYVAQYLNDKIGEAVDLVVSEAAKKIIILSGSKLYSIDIKH